MKKIFTLFTLSLIACDDPNALQNLSTGKVEPDSSVQIDLTKVDVSQLHDNKIILRRKDSSGEITRTQPDVKLVKRLESVEIEIIEPPEGVDVLEFIEELRASGQYDFVEPNLSYTITPPAAPDAEPVEPE